MISTKGKTIHQVADEIFKTLVKQGKQCMTPTGKGCSHGDDEGNHCAIGWLLPEDDPLLMNFEEGVSDLVQSGFHLGPNDKFIRDNKDDMDILQYIHDSVDSESYPDIINNLRCLSFKAPESITKWIEQQKGYEG